LSYNVPEEYEGKLQVGLKHYMITTGLRLSTKERVRTGDRLLASNSSVAYKKHYDGLYRFAAMIGCYGTCFALSHNAPTDFCPSMKDDTVALYMMYKTQRKGDKLTRPDRLDVEVLDVNNNPVICTGDWKDPGNCDQFLTAITRIHHSFKQRGQYFESCDACVSCYSIDNSSTGCRFHPGQFLIWRRGNPRYSERVQNAYHAAKDLCSSHVVKGSYQLLPQEVMAIRRY
jgi:hypothetical protein